MRNLFLRSQCFNKIQTMFQQKYAIYMGIIYMSFLQREIYFVKIFTPCRRLCGVINFSVYWNDDHTSPSWHSDVVTTLWQRRCWRCDNVVARSKMRVVPTSVPDVVTTSPSNVVKTLPQRRHNIKHWISVRPFYYGLFWFLYLHRNVKLQKC